MNELFLNWLRSAINFVPNGYFGHSERVFCYELYHRIRVGMFLHEREHGRLNNIFLHSEIVKAYIDPQTAEEYNIIPLNGQMSPDFILHEPNTADQQIAAVEVKATENLSHAELHRDLDKLTQLKNNYNFQVAVFLAINIDSQRIENLIQRNLHDYNDIDPQIKIWSKLNRHALTVERTVADYIT